MAPLSRRGSFGENDTRVSSSPKALSPESGAVAARPCRSQQAHRWSAGETQRAGVGWCTPTDDHTRWENPMSTKKNDEQPDASGSRWEPAAEEANAPTEQVAPAPAPSAE